MSSRGIRASCVFASLLTGCTCAQAFQPDAGEVDAAALDAGALDAGSRSDAAAPAPDAAAPDASVPDASVPDASLTPVATCVRSLDIDSDGSVEWRIETATDASGRLRWIDDDRRGLGLSHLYLEATRWHTSGAWEEIRYGPPSEPPTRREVRTFTDAGLPLSHARFSTPTFEQWRDTWTYAEGALTRFEHREADGSWREAEVRVSPTSAGGEAQVRWTSERGPGRVVRVAFEGTLARRLYVQDPSFERCARFEYDAEGRHLREQGIECASDVDLEVSSERWRWDPAAGLLTWERESEPPVTLRTFATDARGQWASTQHDTDGDGAVDDTWHLSGCGEIDGPPWLPAIDEHRLFVLAGVPLGALDTVHH